MDDLTLTRALRQATDHLPDGEVLLDAIDNMEESMVAYDANGRLLFCNRAFMEMYGYTPLQARPGVHFRELGEIDIQQGNVVVADDNGEDYLTRKAEYRKKLEGSFTVKLNDGRWIQTTDRPMSGGGFVSVHIDITETRLTQEMLGEAEALSRAHERELEKLNSSLEALVRERTRQLEEAKQRAEELARIDPLTELKNRRAFFEEANAIHEAARRYQHSYSVLMLDIDHFKKINDRYGHQVGDKSIRMLADAIDAIIRKVDSAGRIGGEEFAIVLPETNAQSALQLINRLRQTLSNPPPDQETPSFTISTGIAEFQPDDMAFDQVLARADKALYQAKNAGRDQVCLSEG